MLVAPAEVVHDVFKVHHVARNGKQTGTVSHNMHNEMCPKGIFLQRRESLSRLTLVTGGGGHA